MGNSFYYPICSYHTLDKIALKYEYPTTIISYKKLKSVMLNFNPEEIGFRENDDMTWLLENNGKVHRISFLNKSIESYGNRCDTKIHHARSKIKTNSNN